MSIENILHNINQIEDNITELNGYLARLRESIGNICERHKSNPMGTKEEIHNLVLAVINSAGEEGINSFGIQKVTGFNSIDVRNVISNLCKEGWIEKSGMTRGCKYHVKK